MASWKESDGGCAFCFDVVPGERLGPFVLGTSFQSILTLLRSHRSDIEQVRVKFDPIEPFHRPVEIELMGLKIMLVFNRFSLLLSRIVATDLNALDLRFRGNVLSSSDVPPTFVSVYSMLGPTHPGTFDYDFQSYELKYPEGLSVSFPIPERFRGKMNDDSSYLPMEFPDGTTPSANCIALYESVIEESPSKNSEMASTGKVDKSASAEGRLSDFRRANVLTSVEYVANFSRVRAVIGQGVTFSDLKESIKFGASVQDVLIILGDPPDSYVRSFDSGIRTSTSSSRESVRPESATTSSPLTLVEPEPQKKEKFQRSENVPRRLDGKKPDDYFFNYYSHGLDVLFDGEHHCVKGFVLYAVVPGHWDFFGAYSRCHFRIEMPLVDAPLAFPHTPWGDVREKLVNLYPDPLVIARGSTSHPEFATLLYSFENGFVEVNRRGHIARWTLSK